jgi:hypothetical protein
MSSSKSTTVTREQLEQAAQMRSQGATWNAIREATGSKLGSSGWFKHWQREGIEHAPAGEKPKPAAVSPAVAPAKGKKATTSTRRPRKAAKPQSGPESKSRRT